MDQAQAQDQKANKVLLLGAGNAGKTTLFKQLQYIYDDGFGDADKQKFQAPIWEQMIDALQTMIKVLTDGDNEYNVFEDAKERENAKINPELQKSVDFILGMDGQSGVEMSEDVASHIKALWSDKAIQQVFKLRAKCCVYDSTGLLVYVYNNIYFYCALVFAHVIQI